jgi:hypothetical protein
MFGRGRRKAGTTQVTDAQVEAPQVLIDMAVDAAPSASTSDDTAPITAASAELAIDTAFMAMMSQLDESLMAMARACDRIEQVVAGASRHHPAESSFAGAETATAA